jgi:hypothetical protein
VPINTTPVDLRQVYEEAQITGASTGCHAARKESCDPYTRKCLLEYYLSAIGHGDDYGSDSLFMPIYFNFNHIIKATGIPRRDVKRITRSLAGKGLTQYMSGLFTEDGYAAGAGYSITQAGRVVARDGAEE